MKDCGTLSESKCFLAIILKQGSQVIFKLRQTYLFCDVAEHDVAFLHDLLISHIPKEDTPSAALDLCPVMSEKSASLLASRDSVVLAVSQNQSNTSSLI